MVSHIISKSIIGTTVSEFYEQFHQDHPVPELVILLTLIMDIYNFFLN